MHDNLIVVIAGATPNISGKTHWTHRTLLLLILCICAPNMSAGSTLKTPPKMPAGGQMTPAFFANGTHKCQSKTDIGHTCDVSGIDFDDCEQAAFNLQRDDCCPSTLKCTTSYGGAKDCRYGGVSIEFTMGTCIPH